MKMDTSENIGSIIDRILSKPGIEMRKATCACGAISAQEYPVDYKYVCPVCKKLAMRSRRTIWSRKNINDALALAGVPEEFRNQSFDNFIPFPELRKHIQLCRDYAASPKGSLFLMGDNDQGKSHLGMAILRELTLQGFETRYISIPELQLEIRRSFDGKTIKNEYWFVNRGKAPDFVFLDDLGAEKISEYSESIIYLIINGRIGKLTVTTSNLDLDQIEKVYSGRIATRLVREGPPLDFHVPRYRLREKEEIGRWKNEKCDNH